MASCTPTCLPRVKRDARGASFSGLALASREFPCVRISKLQEGEVTPGALGSAEPFAFSQTSSSSCSMNRSLHFSCLLSRPQDLLLILSAPASFCKGPSLSITSHTVYVFSFYSLTAKGHSILTGPLAPGSPLTGLCPHRTAQRRALELPTVTGFPLSPEQRLASHTWLQSPP